ncbi:MAG: endopeptidase La [Gammaproteobacteria bacterium]|nr:endopeptidase La [Gammaproteobacteria bacterium]
MPKAAAVSETPLVVPILPLRDVVVYPHMVIPLFVGRRKSIKALEVASQKNNLVVLAAQKNPGDDDPAPEQLYQVGTLARILQLLKLPDGTFKLLVEGTQRVEMRNTFTEEDYLLAELNLMPTTFPSDAKELDVLVRSVLTQFEQYIKLNKKIPPEILASLNTIENPDKLADTIAAHLVLKIPDKQVVLEASDLQKRLELLLGYMDSEIDLLQVEKRIRGRVKHQMEKSQREYYLNEQIRAIQKELGDLENAPNEMDALKEKIEKAGMTEEAKTKAMAEFKKLKMMSPMSAEATVSRNYLDWLVNLPWQKQSEIKFTLEEAEACLDKDHYSLDKIKERIIEYLAVQKRVKKLKGPILCLVGPPGVGKTSLGQSIAKATGRIFTRMSLGGIRDEAEVRGHRRTYIGALPGKIIQKLTKAGVRNPLFLLDEIDKMAMDFRGDPASALLEVLDPEQNNTFNDHYLEVDYDLSDVMFIATANTLNIPPALADRMEIIRLPGYIEDEKVNIAERHLIPKELEANGLKSTELEITTAAILEIIRFYTREAGVRSLEREIAKICRKAVKKIVSKKREKKIIVNSRNLERYLGVKRFRYGIAEEKNSVGLVNGLAWTEVGGELLTIEAAIVPGKGKPIYTGHLGEVMQESIQAAMTVVRSRSNALGIPKDFYEKNDIHVHVPEGATPKDGPSAGIGMCTALVSALTKIPVRADVAMTGEITLRGEVLPIGGLKEKLLAAHRAGVKTVLIPEDNRRDLKDIPKNIKHGLEIKPVKWIDEVLQIALQSQPQPLPPEVPTAASILATPVTKLKPDGEQELPSGGSTH